MRGRTCIASFAAILSLSLLFTGFSAGEALAFCERYPYLCGGWTHDQILLVPPIVMNDAFTDLFDQRDRPIRYKYKEAVKLVGHSCGATSGGWVITKKALDLLHLPDEIPERGNILVYADGAEHEWNFGVIGEVISFITGAASSGGFSGAEFGACCCTPPKPPCYCENCDLYVRKNKMIYTETPTGRFPPAQGFVTWKFERIDTGDSVCLDYKLGMIQPNPMTDPIGKIGAKVASGAATEEEAEAFAAYWNERVEFVFDNADMLVTEHVGDCPIP